MPGLKFYIWSKYFSQGVGLKVQATSQKAYIVKVLCGSFFSKTWHDSWFIPGIRHYEDFFEIFAYC